MIEPGKTIGLLGGGQIAKMTAQAASTLGYKTHIYSPEADSPAFLVTDQKTIKPYNDLKSLEAFAKTVDVVTFDFEYVPHGSIQLLEEFVPVYPKFEALHLCQNRLKEKRFAEKLGIASPGFAEIHTLSDLQSAFRRIDTDCLLKSVDSKAVHWIDSNSCLEAAFEIFDSECGILEAFVPFEKELSLLIARDEQGNSTAFPLVETTYLSGQLQQTLAPASISPEIAFEAEKQAKLLADHLQLVGILAVEFFLTHEGSLLFNKMSPRPHNSGHWTLDGCSVSQFEQLVRAICSLPLVTPRMLMPVRMQNLIGEEAKAWKRFLSTPGAKVHLYGKQIKPGQEMGHVNHLS